MLNNSADEVLPSELSSARFRHWLVLGCIFKEGGTLQILLTNESEDISHLFYIDKNFIPTRDLMTNFSSCYNQRLSCAFQLYMEKKNINQAEHSLCFLFSLVLWRYIHISHYHTKTGFPLRPILTMWPGAVEVCIYILEKTRNLLTLALVSLFWPLRAVALLSPSKFSQIQCIWFPQLREVSTMSTRKVIRETFPEDQEPKGLPFSRRWRKNENLWHCSQCIIQNTSSSPTKTDRNFLYWEQIFYYTNVLNSTFFFFFQDVVLPVPELEKIFPQAMTRSVFQRGQLTTPQTCNIS